MPKFIHLACILPDPPKSVISRIENCAVKFIQSGGYKTTKNLIFSPKSVGGLGLLHFTEHWNGLRTSWLKRTFKNDSFWLQLLTENSQEKKNFLFCSDKYIETVLSGECNTFWHHILLSWKKLKRNVKHGITDRFKIYTDVPELFSTLENAFPNRKFLKNYITPEVFIQMEIVNEKEVYFFRKYEDVSALLNDSTFNFLDYMHIKKYLMPIIEKCWELKPF